MKKSLSHLPQDKREDLKHIVGYVLEVLCEQCEMIILYGSYARGNYVDYDQRTEYGVPTYFMSDYDILVLTNQRISGQTMSYIFSKIKKKYYHHKGNANRAFTTSLQFIHEPVEAFNKAISYGQYFYSDIKKEGILLYDSKHYKVPRRHKLDFTEIRDLAKRYFDERFETADDFLDQALYAYKKEKYKIASFLLHQACEHFYRTIILTFTLYSDKTHDLEDLSGMAKAHTLEIAKAFPRGTEKEQRLFQLLNEAYIQARYNPQFVVTREDIEAVLPQVELLREITCKVCEEKIAEYESQIR